MEIKEVIEHFIHQLKNSGYMRKQAREIVVCGVVGWRRKMERKEKAGQRQYQDATETLEERTNKKLLEKVTWFRGKGKKRKMEEKESKFQYCPARKKRNSSTIHPSETSK